MSAHVPKILMAGFLVAVAVMGRWLPHPPNFTPVLAICLYAGLHFRFGLWALTIPVLAMFVSDLFLGFHDLMWVIYPSLLIYTWLCLKAPESSGVASKAGQVVTLGVGGSLWFFVVSNLGVWLTSGMYPVTWEGLVMCFVAALPFFHNTLISTLLFSGVLFAVDGLVQKIWVSKAAKV